LRGRRPGGFLRMRQRCGYCGISGVSFGLFLCCRIGIDRWKDHSLIMVNVSRSRVFRFSNSLGFGFKLRNIYGSQICELPFEGGIGGMNKDPGTPGGTWPWWNFRILDSFNQSMTFQFLQRASKHSVGNSTYLPFQFVIFL